MERRDFLSTSVMGSMGLAGLPTESFYKPITDTPTLKPFTIAPREPLSPGPGNIDMRIIVHSSRTNNQFSNIEGTLGPKQMGPAPHIHKDLDELMYVVEGTATIMIGKELYTVEAGGWNFRPRGIAHSFWNASDKPLRFIDCFFNQNLEDYLDELFHQIIPDMMKNNLTPASPEIASRIAALDKKFGITWFHEQRQGIIDKYGLKA